MWGSGQSWEEYVEEEEREAELHPKCVFCGSTIWEEYYYDVHGEIYCERCMNKVFREDTYNYVMERK